MEENKNPELEAIKQVGEQVKAFKETLGAKAEKTEIAEIQKSIEALKANVETLTKEKVGEQLAAIQTKMKEISEDIALVKDKDGNAANSSKSFGQIVVEKMKEAGLFEGKLNKTEHRTLEIKDLNIVKVAGNMGTGNVTPTTGGAIPYELAQFEPGLTNIQKRKPFLMDISNVSPISTMYAMWAEKENQDGAANETAEGSAKNKIDFDWVEKSAKVEKITAYIKTSKESLSDLPGLANEIDTELREEVLLKADSAIYSGDGSTPSLNGLLNQDTAYAAGSFAATITTPNYWDVLRTAIAQIVKAKFVPNYVIMHPTDVAKLDLSKDSLGQYVLPPFKSQDGLTISGVRVIENTGVTEGDFTVGDFSKLNIRVREGFNIDMGHDADDFTKNLITILGEVRLVVYVKTNHQGAFVTGTFSTAIDALTKP